MSEIIIPPIQELPVISKEVNTIETQLNNDDILNNIKETDSLIINEEPKVEEPKVEEPKVEEPKVEEPKVEEPKVEEPKVEEPKVEESDIFDLLGTLNKLFDTQEKIDELKVKVNMDTKDIDFIKKLLDVCPDLFKDISTSLDIILKDKIINTKDIPYIIKMVKDSYKNIVSSSNKLKNITLEDSLLFIKNIILILMEYDYIQVENKDDMSLVIDLCIDLLRTNLKIDFSFIGKTCNKFIKCFQK